MPDDQTTRPTITCITIATYGDNVVADSEYTEGDSTYPRSMWAAATARVVSDLESLYPGTEIVTDASADFAYHPGLTVEMSDGPVDDMDFEAVRQHVNDAWNAAIIATPLTR